MADVIDLTAILMQRKKGSLPPSARGVEHLLDLRDKKVHFSPMVAGSRGRVRIGVVLHNKGTRPSTPIGALILEQEQWEEFKLSIDRLLNAHLSILK